MDQNLADDSELKQLAVNAKETFGLIVCFGCSRAFSSKDKQVKNCPNCRAKLSGPLIHPESKPSSAEKTKKQPPLASPKTKKQASRRGWRDLRNNQLERKRARRQRLPLFHIQEMKRGRLVRQHRP